MNKLFLTLAFIAGALCTAYLAKDHSPFFEKTASSQDSSKRIPAAVEDGQQELIDRMTRVILSISNKEEVLAKSKQVLEMAKQGDPKGQMPGVQLLAGYMKALPGLEGILYRCRAIIEPSDWMHMSVLTALRSFRYNSYLYGKHILAIFDFISAPSNNAGPSFSTVNDLQVFLVTKIAPLLEQFSTQAMAMEKLSPKRFDFKLDRTLFIGIDDNIRFLEPDETSKRFIKPYIYSIAFGLKRSLSTLYYWSSLNLNDLPAVTSGIIAETNINQFKGKLRSAMAADSLAKGVTPLITFKVIRQFNKYLTYRDLESIEGDKTVKVDTAQSLLDKSYTNAREAASLELAAFNCIIEYTVANNTKINLKDCVNSDNQDYSSQHASDGQDYLFNPNQLLIDYKIKKAAYVQRNTLFNESGPLEKSPEYVSITSEVTGKTLELNIRALFNAKNSLRNSFPTQFENENKATYPTGNTYGWYYNHGNPTAYGKDYSFGGFFNPNEVHDLKSLKAAMTTLVYTKSISSFAALLPVPSPIGIPVPTIDTMNAN